MGFFALLLPLFVFVGVDIGNRMYTVDQLNGTKLDALLVGHLDDFFQHRFKGLQLVSLQ